jgi:hypothetical protein
MGRSRHAGSFACRSTDHSWQCGKERTLIGDWPTTIGGARTVVWRAPFRSADFWLKRMDNILIVVEDLKAVK